MPQLGLKTNQKKSSVKKKMSMDSIIKSSLIKLKGKPKKNGAWNIEIVNTQTQK